MRKPDPGLQFYRVECDHIRDKRIILLRLDHGSDGDAAYWIFSCIQDQLYKDRGYYFDLSDIDNLAIFCADICKKSEELVRAVIDTAIRRELFDKKLFDKYKILTSEYAQNTYIIATKERRRKGSVIELRNELLLVKIGTDQLNIILSGLKSKKSVKHSSAEESSISAEGTRRNPQSRVEAEKREDKSNKTLTTKGKRLKTEQPAAGAEAPAADKSFWQKLVDKWFDFYKGNFRGEEPNFTGRNPRSFEQLVELLQKRARVKGYEWNEINGISSLDLFLQLAFKNQWLSEHFLLKNLVEQFDAIYAREAKTPPPAPEKKKQDKISADIQFIVDRYRDGDLDDRILTWDIYIALEKWKLVPENYVGTFTGVDLEHRTKLAIKAWCEKQILSQPGIVPANQS